MLVTLEGYNDENLLGKFKKIKKLAKKAAPIAVMATTGIPITPKMANKILKKAPPAVRKAVKTVKKTAIKAAPYALTAATGIPIPPSVAKKVINKSMGIVKNKPEVQKAVTVAALEKIGVQPEDVTSINDLTPQQVDDYQEARQDIENKTISKVAVAEASNAEPVEEDAPEPVTESEQVETAQAEELLGAFKKLKKAAKKVAKSKVAKVTKPILKKAAPYALSLASTAAGVPIPPQVFSKAIAIGSGAVKGKKAVKQAITKIALEKIGVNPDDLKSETGISNAIKLLAPGEKQTFAETRKNLENQAISKVTQRVLNESAAPKLKKVAAVKESEKKAWTPEQIAEFNRLQKSGVELQESFDRVNTMDSGSVKKPESAIERIKRQDRERQNKIKESAGDAYYKQGLLHGDDATVKLLAAKIFTQNSYSDVNLLTADHVKDIIKAYVYTSAKISEDKKKSYYYTGTTEAERQKFFGNIYIRAVYLYMKGVSTEAEAATQGYDYNLRDRIWVVIALIKKFAEDDNTGTFMSYWKPYENKEKVKSLIENAPSAGGMNKGLIIAAGIAGLVLLPKLLKR